MTRRMCLAVVAIALLIGASPTAAGAASNWARQTSSCVVAISALRFHPRHVAPGGSSVVRLTARNCSHQAQYLTLTWFGRFLGSETGIPPGCPAIDPVAQPASFNPRGAFRAHLGFL